MKLLAVLLLLGMFSLSVAEVVKSFKETCSQFFIKDNNKAVTPTVFEGDQYKQICQFYKEKYMFATLYDTTSRIPVYSAYTYKIPKSSDQPINKKGFNWKIEPQLDEEWTVNNREMREEVPILKQALNKDYTNTSPYKADTSLNIKYSRGHVFPQSYAQGDHQKESTYTLTNAAPQIQDINEKWAKHVEIPMLTEIKGNCDNKDLVYIVTGVVPGDMWLPIKREGETIEQGVNIPKYFWTAFSCKPKKNSILKSLAYIAEQITNLSADKLTVEDLNERLRKLYQSKTFSVFGKIKHK